MNSTHPCDSVCQPEKTNLHQFYAEDLTEPMNYTDVSTNTAYATRQIEMENI